MSHHRNEVRDSSYDLLRFQRFDTALAKEPMRRRKLRHATLRSAAIQYRYQRRDSIFVSSLDHSRTSLQAITPSCTMAPEELNSLCWSYMYCSGRGLDPHLAGGAGDLQWWLTTGATSGGADANAWGISTHQRRVWTLTDPMALQKLG